MATSRENLFDKLNGSYWNAGVTFERTNPVPLEKYSVFKTYAEASAYALTNVVAYPGQPVAVVGETATTLYYINTDGALCAFATGGSTSEIWEALKEVSSDLSTDYVGKIAALSDALSGDVGKLSADLSGDIESLSSALSGDVDTLSSDLSGEIEALSDSLSSDIQKLSDDLSREIEDQIQALSDSISNTVILNVKNLQDQIDANDADIEYLASVSADHDGKLNGLIAISADMSATIAGTYLSAETFKELSNYTGLSAANPVNPVVTKKDIADLAGAMHFRGATTSEMSTGAEIVPEGTGWYDSSAEPPVVPTAGDVVIVVSTAREYLWVGKPYGDEDQGHWVELGDEDLYAKKADLELSAETLCGWILEEESARIDNDTWLSSQLSSNITALTAEIERATLAEGVISSAVDRKIYIDGVQAETLSAIHADADDYHAKVIAGTVLSNELWVLSADFVNVYGEQIKNLAEPTDDTDAATKKYVDDQITAVDSDITSLTSDVKELSDYTHALSVSQIIWDIDEINCGDAS